MIALNLRDRPFGDLAGPLWLGQSAPLGWLALQRVVVLAGGTSEYALRLVPVCSELLRSRSLCGPAAGGWARSVLRCSSFCARSGRGCRFINSTSSTTRPTRSGRCCCWHLRHGRRMLTDRRTWTRRVATWWAAAAAGQWLANGALLIVPGCALVLLVMSWRRHGQRAAVTFTLLGVVWLASFGLNYVEAMRHTLNSEFLRTYWASSLPSASIGLRDTRLAWRAVRTAGAQPDRQSAVECCSGCCDLRLRVQRASLALMVYSLRRRRCPLCPRGARLFRSATVCRCGLCRRCTLASRSSLIEASGLAGRPLCPSGLDVGWRRRALCCSSEFSCASTSSRTARRAFG